MATAIEAALQTRQQLEGVMSTVFVVDDDVSIREAVEAVIRSAGFRVETFSSASHFLTRSRINGPSCLVLDVGLPDISGLDLQKLVADERRNMPIIFITGCGDIPMTVRAMKAGAADFLTKPFEEEVLLTAVRHALERSRATLNEEVEMRAIQSNYATLSQRERDVMALVVSGLLNKQVGAKLGITEITVKAHRGAVMRKMNARSLAELVTIAGRLGLETGVRTGLQQ